MALKELDQLISEIDTAVHPNGPNGKTTADSLGKVLKSMAIELITQQQEATAAIAQKADLDEGGQIPSAQLPSYVDDIVEAASLAALPEAGEAGKVYVTLDTNKQYRWSGSMYVLLTDSGLTTDVKAALEASHNPSATNAFVTQVEVTDAINVAVASSTMNDSNFVHKTGDESVGGNKTFTMPVTISSPNANGLIVSAASGNSGVPVAQFLAPANNENIFFAIGKQLNGSALFGYSSTGSGPHAFFTTYGRPETDFTIAASNGYTGLGTSSPTERLDVQGNVKAIKFIGDGSQLTNLPVTPPVYYAGTGQNTNGAMTQKATTDALATKQGALAEQVVLFLGSNTAVTNLTASHLNKVVLMQGNSDNSNKTIYLPVPTLADLGKVMQLTFASYSLYELIDINWVVPGTPPGASFPRPSTDTQLLQLYAFCPAMLQVVSYTRSFPYNDTIASWVVTGADTSRVTTRTGSSAVYTTTADGAQTVPIGLRGRTTSKGVFLVSVTCQEAGTNKVKTIWDAYCSVSGQNLTISADAGIITGDKIVVKYTY